MTGWKDANGDAEFPTFTEFVKWYANQLADMAINGNETFKNVDRDLFVLFIFRTMMSSASMVSHAFVIDPYEPSEPQVEFGQATMRELAEYMEEAQRSVAEDERRELEMN